MKDSKNIIFNIPKNKFNEVLEDDFIKDINITLDEVKTVAESWELNEDFGEAISIILPDGTVYDLDSFDVHVYFANVFTQPEASIEDDKEDTTKDAYDVLDYLYYNLGIIGTNSGTSYYDDHCKVIICKKPTDIQYSKIREFLDASLDKRYVWIYCEEEYNRYDFEQVTVDEIIDKIKRYFAFGRLEENYTSGLKSYNSLDGTDKMWVPGHTFKTADGTKKYYRGTEFIVPRNETACKIYDNIIKAGFNCYVDGPRQSEYDIRNLPEKIDSAEIYADDGTDDIEFHVRLVGDKYLQFREVYIRDNKKGKGLIGKLIKAVLDAIDSSWQVEVHVNINNEFWSHIVNKYPNYKWMGVSILKEMAEFKKISPITYFIPTTLKRIWGREFPNYHIEEVNIEDIIKTNHLLDNNSVLERRPDIWGSSYKNYHFKPDIAAYDVHYPIRLDQKHRILDGNHRFIALFNDGYKTAEVLVKNKELKESIGDKVLTNSKTINEGSHLVDKDNKAVFYTDSAYTLKNYIINNVKDEFIRVIYYPDSSIYCFCDADMGIHSMLEEMVQEAGLVDDGAPAERYVIYSKELDHEDVIDYGNDVTIYEYPEFFFAVVQDYGMFTSSSLFEALGKPINKYGWEDYHLVEKIVKKGSKWQVQSEKGRNMGTYDTKAEAEKRLQQVHYFKHMNEDLNTEFSYTLEAICKQYPDLISNIYKSCGNAFIMPDGKFILSGKQFDTHRDFAIQTIMDLENKTLDEIDDEWDTNYILKSFTEYFNLIRVNDGSNEEMDDRAYFVILKNTMTPAQHNSLLNYLDVVLKARTARSVQAFVGRNQCHGYWQMSNTLSSDKILDDCKFAMIRGFFAESLNKSKGKDTFIFNGKKAWSGAVNTLDGTIEEVHSYKEAAEVGFHHSFYFSDNQLMKMEEGETCFFCVFPDHSIQINGMMRFNPEDAGITLDEKFLENRIREQITFTE